MKIKILGGILMKKLVLCIIFLNIVLIAYSQQLLVAVTDFTAGSGYSGNEEELKSITELFAGILRETGKIRVLTRSQWESILKEHSFQRGGLVAQTEIRQLGIALGAKAVVTGAMMKLGSTNILNTSLLDVESGEMLSTARKTYKDLDEFIDVVLPSLAKDIVKLLEKPTPLIGTWIGNGRVIEFNNDGTFICSKYYIKTIDNSETLGGLVKIDLTTTIEGSAIGTYGYTNSSLTLNYTISGIRTAQTGDTMPLSYKYNEKGSCTVSYSISANGKELQVGTAPFFITYRQTGKKNSEKIEYCLNFSR